MIERSPVLEIVEKVAFEVSENRKFIPRLVGKITLPDVVVESYYRARDSNQLVIPHYAYPFNTVEIDDSGRDVLV